MNFIKLNVSWTLHALILFTILSIFFITIGFKLLTNEFTKALVYIIKKNLPGNLNNIIESLIYSFLNKYNIPSNIINSESIIKTALNEINNKVDDINDTYAESNNKNLKNKIIIINIILWIIFIIILVSIKMNQNIDINIYKIIKHTIIIYIIIGVIEVIIFNYIVLKYIPASPSDLQNYIITRLLNKLEKK
jgi:uncharacterized BrkB/YihY/UPF0761 family membrane protein